MSKFYCSRPGCCQPAKWFAVAPSGRTMKVCSDHRHSLNWPDDISTMTDWPADVRFETMPA